MREFEVMVQARPNARILAWRIKARDAQTAKVQAEHMLKLQGAKTGKVLGVNELKK
jgi:hypothetical protein